MDKFLETYNLPKLNQEESENLNRQSTVHLVKLKIVSIDAEKALDKI